MFWRLFVIIQNTRPFRVVAIQQRVAYQRQLTRGYNLLTKQINVAELLSVMKDRYNA